MARFKVKEGCVISVGHKDLKAGEEFDAPDGESKIWRTIDKVEEVLDPPRRGRYNRRDMRAEGE